MPTHSRINQPPLEGRHVAVACSPDKSASLLEGLREMGARVDALAVIAIRELEDQHALDAALSRLDSYSWIIFTSSYAAHFFSRRVRALEMTDRLSSLSNVCAIGPGTAATLKEYGIEVALIPEEFVAEGVVRAIAASHGSRSLAGARILIPRAKEAREVLHRELAAAGAEVDIAPCYETVPGKIDAEVLRSLREHTPDLIVFTSSSTVRNFVEILGKERATDLLHKGKVAVLGPITADTMESLVKKPEIRAQQNTIPSLLDAIRDYFA